MIIAKRFLQQLFFSLLKFYALILRFKRRVLSKESNKQSALVVPAAAPGNLGDEALVISTVAFLHQKGMTKIGLISYNPALVWRGLKQVYDTIELSPPFYRNFWRELRFTQAIGRFQHVYILGADMLDGYYSDRESLLRLNFAALAAKTGADTVILSASLNTQPTASSTHALSTLPLNVRLCARDPISQHRFSQIMGRPVDLVADVAFLLRPCHDTSLVASVSQWINQQKIQNRVILGINASAGLINNFQEQTLDSLVQYYVNTLIEIFGRSDKLSFVLLTHDFRSTHHEVDIAKAIVETLPLNINSRCLNIPGPYSAAEVKAICGELDLVLSGKMHLAIACLGQATPVACISYQDKFEGLFQQFDLENMIIEPTEAFQPGRLADFLWPLIEKRKEIRHHIQLKLPYIQQLAQANFE